MGVPRRQAWCLLFALLLGLLAQPGLSQDARKRREQGERGADAKVAGSGKPFERGGSKPARDYTEVDPSFKASLEGSMTGGKTQMDVETRVAFDLHSRLESLLRGTRTEECQREIMQAYLTYMGAQALERSLPFESEKFGSQCTDPTNRPEVPSTGLIDPEEVRLVYVVLAHEEPAQVVRLVNALDDTAGKDRTWFIIHIDAKADDVQRELVAAFKDRTNIVMMEEGRMDVAWGGFNVVQASLNAVSLALKMEIPFHWLWILSGTTYPIASNDAIRAKLSSHHPESIFMEVKTAKHNPASTAWHYFVECDSALHRIGRNLQPRGLDMYVGSQWLAMPPSAARWLMEDKHLVPKYTDYAKHIVVADENFLPTMFKNSPLCSHIVSSNLVHVQFDRYEHTLDREDRRSDKCLMPNPDHCGRSPATMTLDYLSVLEHSGMLFARKFNPKNTEVFQVLDRIRAGEQPWREGPTFTFVSIRTAPRVVSTGDDASRGDYEKGEGLCLSLEEGPKRGSPRRASHKQEADLVKCSEGDGRQVFKLGPCSSDGHLELGNGGRGFMKSTRGEVSGRAPSCSFTSARGTCLDVLGEAKGPGAPAISYKCHNRWNQFFSFGEGELEGHIISNVPKHLAMADEITGGALCLEAVTADGGGLVVETAECSAERDTQKFSVMQLGPPSNAAAANALVNDGAAPSEEACDGPEGTCPAAK